MSRESKFLSRVLRHDPDLIGVRLDRRGWIRIEELLRGLKRAGRGLTRAELLDIVENNDKQRFAISADGLRIRASQGHSLEIDLGLAPVAPPEILYHGTASRNLDAIFSGGLNPGRRQLVHLSGSQETAWRVGRRHGKSVVLIVDAGLMHGDGYEFFLSENGVWLTAYVPASYLGFVTTG